MKQNIFFIQIIISIMWIALSLLKILKDNFGDQGINNIILISFPLIWCCVYAYFIEKESSSNK